MAKGLAIDIFQDQYRLILQLLSPQDLADTSDRVERPGHLVFFFQGSKVSPGGVAFGRFLDNHLLGVIRKRFNGDCGVALIKYIFLG